MAIKYSSIFILFYFSKSHMLVGFALFASLDLEILFEVWPFQSSIQKAEATVIGMKASFLSLEKSGVDINIAMY